MSGTFRPVLQVVGQLTEQGGFGLPWPTFNEAQPVNGRARRLWVSDFIAPDLLWKDAKLCIEYDSDTHHSGSERIARDASRRDVLEELGLRVVTVTSEQCPASASSTELSTTS
jgi:hypothetical protein